MTISSITALIRSPQFVYLVPFILNFPLILASYWGFSENTILPGTLSVVFLGIGILLWKQSISNDRSIPEEIVLSKLKTWVPYLFGIQLFLFVLLPIRNLNYGDGILLLENILLEGSIFGYQITLDEFWEAFLHSYLFGILEPEDPRSIYRWVSTCAGFVYLFFILILTKRNIERGIFYLTPGVLLLFYGYSENYTLVTLWILVTLYFGGKWIEERRSESFILLIAILASLSASFHLVYGYMGIALIYFTWKLSRSRLSFIRNAICATIMGGVYLGLLFGYFLFLSDPTTSPSQTHVLSPPLYPWKRWVSMNHFKEILGVFWFTSIFSGIVILASFRMDKEEFIRICKLPKTRFYILASGGFFLHAFFHNPSLGYPADWDLFSFYSLPLLFVGMEFYSIWKRQLLLSVNLATYCILFHISTAYALSINPPGLEEDYNTMVRITNQYIKERSSSVQDVHKNSKKMFLKLDHFLFKANLEFQSFHENIQYSTEEEPSIHIERFQNELNEHLRVNQGSLGNAFLKDYLNRLTEFHHILIEARREDKKYRLEM